MNIVFIRVLDCFETKCKSVFVFDARDSIDHYREKIIVIPS